MYRDRERQRVKQIADRGKTHLVTEKQLCPTTAESHLLVLRTCVVVPPQSACTENQNHYLLEAFSLSRPNLLHFRKRSC